MATPPAYIDAVVDGLASSLATHGVRANGVRSIDWDLEGGESLTTVSSGPSVLVMADGGPISMNSGVAPSLDLAVVVFCTAKTRSKDADLGDVDTRGDLAGFIACQVGAIAMDNDWGNPSDVVLGLPKAIKVRNLHTKRLKEKGLALWVCGWTQNVKIDALVTGTFGPLDYVRTKTNLTEVGSPLSADRVDTEEAV